MFARDIVGHCRSAVSALPGIAPRFAGKRCMTFAVTKPAVDEGRKTALAPRVAHVVQAYVSFAVYPGGEEFLRLLQFGTAV
jgi:hypothetical protein